MRTVVLIKGRAGSGKDTLASMVLKHLKELSNLEVKISPNAEKVKQYARHYFDWDGEKDDKGRKLLIDITNAGYNYDQFFWEKLNPIFSWVTLIPDWRYESTYEYFKETKGYNVITVNVIRPNVFNPNCLELQFDPSETTLDTFKCDYEIVNDASLVGLNDMARQLALEIKRECDF